MDTDEIGFTIDDLLRLIVKTYLIKTYCLTIITDRPITLVEDVPMVNYDFSSNLFNLSDATLDTLEAGCSDYIISMRNPSKFIEAFDESIHITNQRRGNRKLMFFPNENTLENRQILIDILAEDALNFLPDVLLILPFDNDNNCSSYELGTHKYIGETKNQELLILDTWDCTNGLFVHNNNLFPDKLKDMHGRKVKMATFSYKPYSILELDDKDQIIGLDGTEMKAAIEFCKWSNCTIDIIRDDVHEWGEIWENRTGNGILGNIVTDRADVGYGALYSWYHEYLFLDLTMPIVRTGITCIAPVPRLVASWLLPVLPFNSLMWSSVLVALIIGAAGIFATGRVAKKPFSVIESSLATLGILVAQVPPVRSPPAALRYVMTFLLVLSLVLSNVYSSGLASSITVPRYEDPIDTVQQLVDSNLDWGATHDAWIFSILLSTEKNIVYLVNKFKKWPEKRLRSKGKTRDFAYSIERLPAGHYAIGEYVTEDSVPFLQLMQQDIYWEQCVFMARKSSPFTRRINTFFGRLHQSGIPHSWETQVVLKHSNYKVQLAVRLSLGRHGDGGGDPRPLGLRHFLGPLFLWGFGVLSAFVALILECFFKCVQSQNKPKKIV